MEKVLYKINLAVVRCSIGAPMRPFHGLGLEEVQVGEASQLFSLHFPCKSFSNILPLHYSKRLLYYVF